MEIFLVTSGAWSDFSVDMVTTNMDTAIEYAKKHYTDGFAYSMKVWAVRDRAELDWFPTSVYNVDEADKRSPDGLRLIWPREDDIHGKN